MTREPLFVPSAFPWHTARRRTGRPPPLAPPRGAPLGCVNYWITTAGPDARPVDSMGVDGAPRGNIQWSATSEPPAAGSVAGVAGASPSGPPRSPITRSRASSRRIPRWGYQVRPCSGLCLMRPIIRCSGFSLPRRRGALPERRAGAGAVAGPGGPRPRLPGARVGSRSPAADFRLRQWPTSRTTRCGIAK